MTIIRVNPMTDRDAHTTGWVSLLYYAGMEQITFCGVPHVVTVLGAGSWGTALAYILAENGRPVTLWDRSSTLIDEINSHRVNSKYLPALSLPDTIVGTSSIADAISPETTIIIVAVPSSATREISYDIERILTHPVAIVSAAKGLDADTGMTMTETIFSIVSRDKCRGAAALSGPNLAKEVVRKVPTVCISASSDQTIAREAQNLFMSPSFRVYTHSDVRGVELAGALKNVLAIGAGVCEGLGYGDNTKAAMMTRGLMEMTVIGVAAGANPMTFLGIAGVGDLMATAAGKLSRNYRVGFGLASGRPLDEILAEIGQAAEGVPTSIAAYAMARSLKVQTPLFDSIHEVLYNGLDPRTAVTELMNRPPKGEFLSS